MHNFSFGLRPLRAKAACIILLCGSTVTASADIWKGFCHCHKHDGGYECEFDMPVSAYTETALQYECVRNKGGGYGYLTDISHAPNRPAKIGEMSPIQMCVPVKHGTVVAEGPAIELFGETTGTPEVCVVGQPHARFYAVHCYMGNGTVRDVPPNMQEKVRIGNCQGWDASTVCPGGYAQLHGPLISYIGEGDVQVACVSVFAEPGTGNRYFGLVGGQPD